MEGKTSAGVEHRRGGEHGLDKCLCGSFGPENLPVWMPAVSVVCVGGWVGYITTVPGFRATGAYPQPLSMLFPVA